MIYLQFYIFFILLNENNIYPMYFELNLYFFYNTNLIKRSDNGLKIAYQKHIYLCKDAMF